LKWQKKINLISNSTISDFWNRHILDSIQLQNYFSKKEMFFDLGSGGGFPAIPLSILGYKIALIESDQRKAIFLKEAIRKLNLDAKVLVKRVEEIAFPEYSIITARAFAPLERILKWLKPSKNMTLILLKGKNTDEEIKTAQEKHNFKYTVNKSLVGQEGKIIKITF